MPNNKVQQQPATDIPFAEVIPLEELPLEKVIDNTLVKHNITNAVIATLKRKFGGLKLKDVNDKESYLEIVAARKEVRKIGILVEQVTKKGRENAVREQKIWLAKEKEISGKVMEVQSPLDAEIKRYEDEQERIEKEAAQKREVEWINRNSQIIKMGATYLNGSFVLNEVSYEADLLKSADDEMWNEVILPKYKAQYEINEQEKVAEENKRKAEMEAAKKQKEEFELQQESFKKEQEEFAKQQRELQQRKDAHELEVRAAEQKKDAEERQKKQTLIDARMKRLNTLNISLDYRSNQYVFINEELNFNAGIVESKIEIPSDLSLLSDTEWDELLESISPLLDAKKKQVEEKRLNEIEKEKQDAIARALRVEELKKQQEEQRKQEEMALASDKEKYADVIKYLKATPIHAMKSPTYKSKMNIINDFIQDL